MKLCEMMVDSSGNTSSYSQNRECQFDVSNIFLDGGTKHWQFLMELCVPEWNGTVNKITIIVP